MAIDPSEHFDDREPQTAQELLLFALVRHKIGLLRYAGTVREQIFDILDATETELRRLVMEVLAGYGGTGRPRDRQRVERLVRGVRELRGDAWRTSWGVWRGEMQGLMRREAHTLDGIVETAAPVVLVTVIPTAQLLIRTLRESTFEGRTHREWFQATRDSDLQRIEDQIRIGIARSESRSMIARRIVGTAVAEGTDGVTARTRRDVTALTRTAVNHIAQQARQVYIDQNDEFFDFERYVAVLDSRTTPDCRSLDGKRFRRGVGPIPPIHFWCRSDRVPEFEIETLVTRPANPTTERMLIREFAEREGLDASLRRRADLPRGFKGRYDEWSRRRIRELVGRYPGKINYEQFLRRQSREFQDDVLGKTRARLFRRGGLTLDHFVDESYRQIRLDDLARMHAEEFRRAGLDPEQFLRSAA